MMVKGEKRAKAEFDVLGKIREEQEKRGWSDYQLAYMSDIPVSTVSAWFSKSTEPGIASLERICNGFGITLSQFFQQDKDSICLTEEQQKLLSTFSVLAPEQKSALQQLLNSFIIIK